MIMNSMQTYKAYINKNMLNQNVYNTIKIKLPRRSIWVQ